MDDPKRTVKFYSGVFGWKAEEWAEPIDYFPVTIDHASKPGIDGALAQRGQPTGASNTIGVTSVDETVEKIITAGGTVVAAETAVPGVGCAAYCRDTEGNLVGLMQDEPSAG